MLWSHMVLGVHEHFGQWWLDICVCVRACFDEVIPAEDIKVEISCSSLLDYCLGAAQFICANGMKDLERTGKIWQG